MKFTITVEGETYTVEIENLDTRPIVAHVDGERFEVWLDQNETPKKAEPVQPIITQKVVPKSNGNGASHNSGNTVKAPIPGVIDSILVNPGDQVKPGQTLCVLEAMKMKNQIRANRAGCIASVSVSVGQQVNHGDVLITYTE